MNTEEIERFKALIALCMYTSYFPEYRLFSGWNPELAIPVCMSLLLYINWILLMLEVLKIHKLLISGRTKQCRFLFADHPWRFWLNAALFSSVRLPLGSWLKDETRRIKRAQSFNLCPRWHWKKTISRELPAGSLCLVQHWEVWKFNLTTLAYSFIGSSTLLFTVCASRFQVCQSAYPFLQIVFFQLFSFFYSLHCFTYLWKCCFTYLSRGSKWQCKLSRLLLLDNFGKILMLNRILALYMADHEINFHWTNLWIGCIIGFGRCGLFARPLAFPAQSRYMEFYIVGNLRMSRNRNLIVGVQMFGYLSCLSKIELTFLYMVSI